MRKILIASLMFLLFIPQSVWGQEKLRVGKSVAVTFEFFPLDFGLELGVWKKRGLDLEVFTFRGGGPLEQAMAAGSLDIGLTAATSIAGAIAKGATGKIIASIGSRPTLMVLIVGKESGIKGLSDLKGKRIGVTSHGSLTDWLAKRLSSHLGWDPETGITRVPLGGLTAQLAALKVKNTDGFIWSAEGGYDAEEKGLGTIILSFGEILKDFEFEVIEASDEILKRNPEAVRKFLQGWYEVIRYMKANKEHTIKRMAELYQLPLGVVRKTYELDIGNLSENGTLNMKGLQVVAESLVELKISPRPLDVKKMYDDRFLPVRP